jgi:hypothetical protein
MAVIVWWFQRWLLFSTIYGIIHGIIHGIILRIDELHHFSVKTCFGKPPSSSSRSCIRGSADCWIHGWIHGAPRPWTDWILTWTPPESRRKPREKKTVAVASCQVPGQWHQFHEWHMNDTWKLNHFLRHCESSVHCMLRNAVWGSPCWLQGECDTYCNQCSIRPRSRSMHFLALRWHYLREKDSTNIY